MIMSVKGMIAAIISGVEELLQYLRKRSVAVRHRSVMIDYSSSKSSSLLEPNDDLPALPIWTFALGVLALLTFGLTSVPAIICGHRALAEPRSNSESLGRSVAIVGLLIGYVGVALLGVWAMVLARFLYGH